jgi:hypothetical protein
MHKENNIIELTIVYLLLLERKQFNYVNISVKFVFINRLKYKSELQKIELSFCFIL